MYHWQFGINGAVIFGRTWDEFEMMMERISTHLGLSATKRIIVYVHNLAYEFQFIRKHFNWIKSFSLEERKPIYACTDTGIEFRCSYILSGYSLAGIAKNLHKYPCEKMVGDLDYSLVRHSGTPLTPKELKYCENDVRVVMAYIQEKIESDGNITKIQLTKTGYVRKYVRDHTILSKDKTTREEYKTLMHELTLQSDEYDALHRCMAGGLTHANYRYVDKVVEDVHSIDFTSSYPSCMIAYKYPMSKGYLIHCDSNDEFYRYKNNPNCLMVFDIKFSGLTAKPDIPDNIISLSKCYMPDGIACSANDCIVNNGRVVDFDEDVCMTITNVDFDNICRFYDFDSFQIGDMWIYKAAYLPKEFIKAILHFYSLKTKLKGVSGMEADYQWAKEMVNSLYGMCVTEICKDETLYEDDEWTSVKLDELDTAAKVEKENNSKKRFLFYGWGVFVTARARYNVCTGILEFGPEDYIYCDTDSNKVRHIENHMKFINDYNESVTAQLKETVNFYDLNEEDIAPLDIKGEAHPLGVWDWETKDNPYIKFKVLGAKRYMVLQHDDKKNEDVYKMTVAGLPKPATGKLAKKYGDQMFEAFNNGLVISPEDAGKNCSTYVDRECEGDVVDYLGNPGHYHELSYIHMAPIGFEFSRATEFTDYLKGFVHGRSY
jgi:hypothetical protein